MTMTRRSRTIQLPIGGMIRVAMAVKDYGSADSAVFVFHGASSRLLSAVFNQLCTVMMQSYTIQMVRMDEMVNGKCPYHLEVTVVKPDFHIAGPIEWMLLMADIMRKYCRCEFDICTTYEMFLNL